jgi:hypothetical protein
VKYRFQIPFDDKEKILPIFNRFGQKPFTRAKVVSLEGMPQISSGDVVRREGHGIIENLGRDTPPPNKPALILPYVWRLTDRTVHALTKKPRKPKQTVVS